MLGRFHEVSIHTPDIRASVEFYEGLGFTQAVTGDTWPHPYGVLTDGRIVIGLHQYRFPSPSLTFVRPGIAAFIPEFEGRGIELAFAKTGDDAFNEIGFLDPAGQMVTILEARTYSPFERTRQQVSLCGDFAAFSIPTTDFDAVRAFWEPLGFVALDEEERPWVHVPVASDHLNLAFHRPRSIDRPFLLFQAPDMAARIASLAERGMAFADELPRGLDRRKFAILEAPEGTPLFLATGEE